MPMKTKESQREYQRKWKAARRLAWMAGKSCRKCGSVSQLEVHHIDQSEKIDHKVWSWSNDRRDRELSKCEILCHLCHQMEHSKLTKKQADEIRYLYETTKTSHRKLAEQFGVSNTTINDIVTGIRWK